MCLLLDFGWLVTLTTSLLAQSVLRRWDGGKCVNHLVLSSNETKTNSESKCLETFRIT